MAETEPRPTLEALRAENARLRRFLAVDVVPVIDMLRLDSRVRAFGDRAIAYRLEAGARAALGDGDAA